MRPVPPRRSPDDGYTSSTASVKRSMSVDQGFPDVRKPRSSVNCTPDNVWTPRSSVDRALGNVRTPRSSVDCTLCSVRRPQSTLEDAFSAPQLSHTTSPEEDERSNDAGLFRLTARPDGRDSTNSVEPQIQTSPHEFIGNSAPSRYWRIPARSNFHALSKSKLSRST